MNYYMTRQISRINFERFPDEIEFVDDVTRNKINKNVKGAKLNTRKKNDIKLTS